MVKDDGDAVLAFSQTVVKLQQRLGETVGRVLADYDLTHADLDVLGALRKVGGTHELRPRELSARLLLTTGGLSNIVRRLEGRGLVRRVQDPTDGRGHHVQLTDAGLELARTSGAAVLAALRHLLADVPPDTLETAQRGLTAVLRTVDPDAGNPPRGRAARRR